ncbi:MAG: metallophosphoesterase family protein [Bacteroidales bacterium]|nr:metallophosphoesterase family protein [Bacteroidales bacterium]
MHIYGKNPICRTDDLVTVQFAKLEEVVKASNKLDCPIIINGDITESPNVGYGIFTTLANIFLKCINGVFFVYGQHDLLWHDLSTSHLTATGALEATQAIRNMDKFWEEFGKKFSYANWGEDINYVGNYLITHKPIVSKNIINQFAWLKHNSNTDKFYIFEKLISQFKLMLCGDWHRRYIYKSGGTLLVNPGALTRREANQDSLDTFPSYVVIDLDTLEYKITPLKCAKPAGEIISDSHLEMAKMKKEVGVDVSQFVKAIELGESGESKLIHFLLRAIKSGEIDKEISEVLKKLISKVSDEKLDYEHLEK